MMQQHRTKFFLAVVLALAWVSLLLGHATLFHVETDAGDGRRSLRALAEYFHPASQVPLDARRVTVYLVEPPLHQPMPVYSTFQTGLLERYGSGKVDFVVRQHTRCDLSCTRPVEDEGPCVAVARERECAEKYLKCNYPKCKTMVPGDEKCYAKKHDIRQYYSSAYGHLHQAYLPLGPRMDSWASFRKIQARPGFVMKKASERHYAFNAIFSVSTNKGRQTLASIIDSRKGKPGLSVFAYMAKVWTRDVNDPRSQQLNTHDTMEVVLDSVFTLSPAGHNPECFRMFEAIEAGSIPVLIKKDLTSSVNKCQDPLHHWQDAPILVIDSWSNLYPRVERLMEDKEALDEMQLNLAIWYEKYMRKVVGDFEDYMIESHEQDLLEEERKLAEDSEQEGGDEGVDGKVAQIAAPAPDPCNDMVLYVPDFHLSFGRQLNNYILSAMLATFMDKPMVVFDPPQDSMCPGEDKVPPVTFSGIVKSPPWLTRGCLVPCKKTRSYASWDNFRRMTDNPPVATCTNDDGHLATVFAAGGDESRYYFQRHFEDVMVRRSSSVAYEWALRAGAEPHEAEVFTRLEGDTMWDYMSALLVRSDVLRLQDPVKKPLDVYIKKHIFPKGHKKTTFDAIHIRRGEDVLNDPEAQWFVDAYWDARGDFDPETLPEVRKYIPVLHYLRHYNAMECSTKMREVYIATDDPDEVRGEIAKLGPETDGAIRLNDCHTFKFAVSPTRADWRTGGCDARYADAIADLGDFIVLRNADTLVGDFISEWGKLIRTFRLVLNEGAGRVTEGILRPASRLMPAQEGGAESDRSPVSLMDTRVAWGHLRPPTPW